MTSDVWKDHYLEDIRESRKTGVPFPEICLRRYMASGSDAPAPVTMYERD